MLLHVKHRRTLKFKRKPKTQAPPPPPPAAPSVPSSHPAPRSDIELRLDLLASQVSTLSELFTARLAAPQAVGDFLPASHAPSQARPESDARCPHPVETAGYHEESQALGGSGREPDAPGSLPYGQAQLGGDLQASAGLGWASLSASPLQAPRQLPVAPGGVLVPPLSAAALGPRFAPPPPGGVQGGPSAHAPPPRFSSAPPGTPRDSGSEDSDSGSSSASAAPDSSAAQLAELVYDFFPEARPVSDSAPPPRCSFESWFDPSPASSFSQPCYRVYPQVDAVESEVADHAAALHRRSKPLSAVLPRNIRRYAVADQLPFVAPQPVNPSFSRLAGASAVGSKRWGSVTFAEMARLERLFRCQLEAMSSSLWMMSGILAVLKRDGFNASTPGLFNTAIASISASLAFQARTAASGSAFLRSKRRESLLAHSKVPIPEPQKRALIVNPGSDSGLFDEPLLDSVAAQVKEDSLVSSYLAVFLRLCPPALVRSLWLHLHRLSPVHLATVLLVRHSGRGSALRPPLALEAASASRVVRGRLLLQSLRVSGSRSHRLA